MSSAPEDTPAAEAQPATNVRIAYEDASRLVTTGSTAQLVLFANVHRDSVRLDGLIKDPLRFREAMATLRAIVGSDYRYVPRDRTTYLAYLRMRRETATLGIRQSQQAFFEWALRNDPLAFTLLDPVVTVHPDQVFFEVFSKDEGAYARLGIDLAALDLDYQPTCGTTNIDFSPTLFQGVEQMRSYRQTRLAIGKEAVKLSTTSAATVLEKRINVPDSWLRGFLQVQSAAALRRDSFQLKPIDLYNVLRHLRLNADRKGRRRALRIELVPGEVPRLVLEPWEIVLSGTADIYRGRTTRVVRVWGRRRLMLLRRWLPFLENLEVHLLGSGLPSFWVLRGGPMTLTLGLTGFTAVNWSQAASFDLLLPRKTQGGEALERVLHALEKIWVAGLEDLGRATGLKGPALHEALQVGCQRGQLMYDLAANVYRLRALTEGPLDLPRLEYRNSAERTGARPAHPPRRSTDRFGKPYRRHRSGTDRQGDRSRGSPGIPAADASTGRGPGKQSRVYLHLLSQTGAEGRALSSPGGSAPGLRRTGSTPAERAGSSPGRDRGDANVHPPRCRRRGRGPGDSRSDAAEGSLGPGRGADAPPGAALQLGGRSTDGLFRPGSKL